jgi:hypothetical protein
MDRHDVHTVRQCKNQNQGTAIVPSRVFITNVVDAALSAALDLAMQGMLCFPCQANKAPTCPSGFKAATSDPAALRDLWQRHPGPLIGVPTGEVNVLDVLDVDPRHGGNAWLAQHGDRLVTTRTHKTRSGGLHFVFHHAPGLRCSAGKIAPGVDVRADGGFVVWWPAAGFPVAIEAPVVDWPTYLLAALMPQPGPHLHAAVSIPRNDSDSARRYAVGALRRAAERVALASEGTRNDTLNRECFVLARFIGDGLLTPGEIAEALAIAARHAGLTQTETARTLASALRAGGAA